VLRFGGGKALTKQVSEETALKCHLAAEEANKVSDSVTKIVENNPFVVCGSQVDPKQQRKLKVALVRARMKPRKSRLGKITQHLYDLESCDESEKPLKIDLDLYQMETF
jgi:cell division GTPase FtsZ